MATQLQIRRGTTTENNVFTGAAGELTMDTDTNGVRIHDGTTVGGVKIPTAQTADYVVEWQVPTDLNGYRWYRKYSSGWVEQGGVVAVNNTSVAVTLMIEMQGPTYCTMLTGTNTTSGGTSTYVAVVKGQSATTFNISTTANYSNGIYWQVSGMAA